MNFCHKYFIFIASKIEDFCRNRGTYRFFGRYYCLFKNRALRVNKKIFRDKKFVDSGFVMNRKCNKCQLGHGVSNKKARF